jgi:epoxyqueuosine reductase
MRSALGNRIYGCDDCLAACPWNKFAVAASDMRYHGSAGGTLAELVVLDDAAFRTRFSGSPVKRIGRDRFVRNVLYSIGNSGDLSLRDAAQALCEDPDGAVADAARWAVAQLAL